MTNIIIYIPYILKAAYIGNVKFTTRPQPIEFLVCRFFFLDDEYTMKKKSVINFPPYSFHLAK